MSAAVTPRHKVTQEELERWAEAAVQAAEPDRVERLEREVENLKLGLRAVAAILTSIADTDDTDLSDISCPCCGTRHSGPGLLEHVRNPPPSCNRDLWMNTWHGRPAEILGRDNIT